MSNPAGPIRQAAAAETISTHVLDLARGVGGRDVPVTLQIKSADGQWRDEATRFDRDARPIETLPAAYRPLAPGRTRGVSPAAIGVTE